MTLEDVYNEHMQPLGSEWNAVPRWASIVWQCWKTDKTWWLTKSLRAWVLRVDDAPNEWSFRKFALAVKKWFMLPETVGGTTRVRGQYFGEYEVDGTDFIAMSLSLNQTDLFSVTTELKKTVAEFYREVLWSDVLTGDFTDRSALPPEVAETLKKNHFIHPENLAEALNPDNPIFKAYNNGGYSYDDPRGTIEKSWIPATARFKAKWKTDSDGYKYAD